MTRLAVRGRAQGEGKTYPKHALERIVISLGGSIVQTPGAATQWVIAPDARSLKVRQ